MSNFGFLKTEWPELFTSAARVEALSLIDPRGACFYARRTLELAVNWLYAHDPALVLPYDDRLSALIHDSDFRQLVPQDVFQKIQVIKGLGNEAVHSNRKIEPTDAGQATKELFHILYWLAGAHLYAAKRFALRRPGLRSQPAFRRGTTGGRA